jgi:hypothetical protein
MTASVEKPVRFFPSGRRDRKKPGLKKEPFNQSRRKTGTGIRHQREHLYSHSVEIGRIYTVLIW